jgi:LacI family transcriptional regulator
MPKKVTLEQIAKEANVSKSTVSLVLLNKDGVGETTRRRVFDTAQSLGYELRKKQRHIERNHDKLDVIFLVEENYFIVAEYFYSRIFQGLKEILEPEGYHPIFSTISDDQLEKNELPPIVYKDTVGGMIIGGELADGFHDQLERLHIPVILVGDDQPSRRWCCILNDNHSAGSIAIQHLLDLGHRRIACLANRNSHPNIRARLDGYLLTMLRSGSAIDRELIVEDDKTVSIDDGFRLAQELLARKVSFSALFAATDATAIGAINALLDAGVRIPDEVSVIGIDNIEWGRHVNPPLTTVDVDRRQWGNLAADCLIYQMRFAGDHPLAHSRIVMPVQLLERSSTRQLSRPSRKP